MASVRVISQEIVQRALSMSEAIQVNAEAFRLLSSGVAKVPDRIILPVPEHDGVTLFKPAYIPGRGLGLKLVSVRPHNAQRGLGTVCGVVQLVDEANGNPIALINGTELTLLRTAAGSGAATQALARKESENLVVFGAGGQGRAHIQAMFCAVPGLKNVSIWNRTSSKAQELAVEVESWKATTPEFRRLESVKVVQEKADIDEAVRNADIIVTATNSDKELFDGALVKPGCHINAIGSYMPAMKELDHECVSKARTFVDCEPSLIIATTGEYAFLKEKSQEEVEKTICGAIGNVLGGKTPGRLASSDVTIFKSVGNAVQDVATGWSIYTAACEKNLGVVVGI